MLKTVLFAALFATLPAMATAAELPAYPFIHVSGTGVTNFMPDIGEIDFEVSARDADPAAALQVVATRVGEIRALMAEVAPEGATLEVRDIRKDIKRGESEATVVYELRGGVKILVKDLSKWRAIVTPLLKMPNLDGFMAAFDTTERARVEAELMADAIKEARRRADVIAAGFGRKTGAVNAVSNGELKNLTRSMNLSPADFFNRRGQSREETAREELLSINALKMSQGVDVIFRIK